MTETRGILYLLSAEPSYGLPRRVADRQLLAQDCAQSVVERVTIVVCLLQQARPRNDLRRAVKRHGSRQSREIAARIVQVRQSLVAMPLRYGAVRQPVLQPPVQASQLRVIGPLGKEKSFQITHHALAHKVSPSAGGEMIFRQRTPVRRQLVFKAAGDGDIVGLVAAEEFGQKAEIFRQIAFLKFVADLFPATPSDHRRLRTHQITPAELLEDMTAIKKDVLVG